MMLVAFFFVSLMLYSMGKSTPRSKIKQSWARKTKFSHNQYWCVSYTECYKVGGERDFKTFIKARSADLARKILVLRLKEDDLFLKVRTVTVSMIHDCWQVAELRKKLSVKQWESIRNVSFPNDWNRLFKFEKKRIDGQLNRYNVQSTTLTKEHQDKLQKASRELAEKYLKGSFKPICPELMKICSTDKYCKGSSQRRGYANINNKDQREMELAYVKKIMKKYHGNRNLAADSIGISRHRIRRVLKRFPEVDWDKEFPLTYTRARSRNSMDCPESRAKLSATLRRIGHKPPSNGKGTKYYPKWKKSVDAHWKAKRVKLYSDHKKHITAALREYGHKRKETAESLKISEGHLSRLMSRFAAEDESFKKEFWTPDILMKVKIASTIKTKKENYLSKVKENKHAILQAYYQNGESDYRAAKALDVDTRTVTKAREAIEEYNL